MNPPKQSYIIWFTPRTGSTYVSELLAATGHMGTPGELFNIGPDTSLAKTYQVHSYESLVQGLWERGSSPNGVFGVKFSLYHEVWAQIVKEIHELKREPLPSATYEGQFLGEIFPNCKHIYLTRRNKIRQAVSWWKAIKKGVWHMREKERWDEEAFYSTNYDFNALSYLLTEISVRECAMEAFFRQNQIKPMTWVYEDLAQDPQGMLARMADFLDLSLGNKEQVFLSALSKQPLRKTSNPIDEQWIQRFREELQADWSKRIW